ncbi:MAG: LOG family protein, partial [Patescibacteria group bacterium]
SEAYIFFPGGFGTLDEFFEIITLIQTKKLKKIPVILVHAHYWEPLLSWMKDMLHKKKKTVNKQDLKIFKLVHTVEEALKTLN